MSMTYANANTEARTEETFVPRYARSASGHLHDTVFYYKLV